MVEPPADLRSQLRSGADDEVTAGALEKAIAQLEPAAADALFDEFSSEWGVPITDKTSLSHEFWIRRMGEELEKRPRDHLAPPAPESLITEWEARHAQLPTLLRRFLLDVSAGMCDPDERRPFWLGHPEEENGGLVPFFVTAAELFAEELLPFVATERAQSLCGRFSAALAVELAAEEGKTREGTSLEAVTPQPGADADVLRDFLVLEHYMEGNHGDYWLLLGIAGPARGRCLKWDSVQHGEPGTLLPAGDLLDFLLYLVFDSR